MNLETVVSRAGALVTEVGISPDSPHWRHLSHCFLILLLLSPGIVPCLAQGQPTPIGTDEFQGTITGSARPSEGRVASYALEFDPRTIRGTEGYSPNVSGIPLNWIDQQTITWDFGDGSDPVTVRDRVSVSHRFEEQGTFDIQAEVSDARGTWLTTSRTVTVRNDEPRYVRLGSIEGAAEKQIVFSASALDTPEDELTYVWNFGDGNEEEGVDLWTVTHTYDDPGEYEVVLRVVDGDGGEESEDKDIVVRDPAGDSGFEFEPAEEPDLETVTSTLGGTIGGQFNTPTEASVQTLGGILLTQIKSGICRLTFTTWDDERLIQGLFVMDFPFMPPDGGRFRFSTPNSALVFHKTADDYLLERRLNNPLGGGPSTGPVPAGSPFGLQESQARYGERFGHVEVVIAPDSYIKGEIQLGMASSNEDFGPINLSADFAINLRTTGFLNRFVGCSDEPFEVTSRNPKANEKHVRVPGSPVRIRFSRDLDHETVHDNSIQVGYRDNTGEFVPAAGRLVRNRRTVYFAPDEPLLSGVKYKVRVKAGEAGVKSIFAETLAPDSDGDWVSWEFTTVVDFETGPTGEPILACHIYQTARDVPLIAGKPAVARIYARWPEHPDVHPDSQVRTISSTISLKPASGDPVGSASYTFVRPDLWGSSGISIEDMEHTAQVPINPVPDELPYGLIAALEVPTGADGGLRTRYGARCPVRMWDQAPEIKIQMYALRVLDWEDSDTFNAALPHFALYAKDIEEYAWQLYPFRDAEVLPTVESVVPMTLDGFATWVDELMAYITPSTAAQEYAQGIRDLMKDEPSDADVLLVMVPFGPFTGGGTLDRLPDGRRLVYSSLSIDPFLQPRWVNAAVHELGHAYGLEHEPWVLNAEARARLLEIRDSGTDLWFHGIEGIRMSRDGRSFLSKSSDEGNQEGPWLVPLMFPGTIDTRRAFIMNQQYRAFQRNMD